jgi:hypothetical protein
MTVYRDLRRAVKQYKQTREKKPTPAELQTVTSAIVFAATDLAATGGESLTWDLSAAGPGMAVAVADYFANEGCEVSMPDRTTVLIQWPGRDGDETLRTP